VFFQVFTLHTTRYRGFVDFFILSVVRFFVDPSLCAPEFTSTMPLEGVSIPVRLSDLFHYVGKFSFPPLFIPTTGYSLSLFILVSLSVFPSWRPVFPLFPGLFFPDFGIRAFSVFFFFTIFNVILWMFRVLVVFTPPVVDSLLLFLYACLTAR